MKKLTFLLFTAILIHATAFSQSCLPNGIDFYQQSHIDNFQSNYPGCIQIEGDVVIGGSSIDNLGGLSILTGIDGNLDFGTNFGETTFNNLNGLENITEIGGSLVFFKNTNLINLSGLDSLTTIGGGLIFSENSSMHDMTGLENLTNIGGDLMFIYSSVDSLTGLENLTSIGGDIVLSITGLKDASQLSNLENLGGGITLYGNTDLYAMPDVFGISEIEFVSIDFNPNLNNLDGLINVTVINGHLSISNSPSLDIQALSSLISVGTSCQIDNLVNETDFSDLANLKTIGDRLSISYCDGLTSLSGLDNIVAESISDLRITFNPGLSTCEVQSICDYLASPNGEIIIHDNAPGCNTPEEIESACLVGINEITPEQISIYPNPATNEVFITLENGQPVNEITIYNQLGQIVLKPLVIT